jgi:hypothetical protein
LRGEDIIAVFPDYGTQMMKINAASYEIQCGHEHEWKGEPWREKSAVLNFFLKLRPRFHLLIVLSLFTRRSIQFARIGP